MIFILSFVPLDKFIPMCLLYCFCCRASFVRLQVRVVLCKRVSSVIHARIAATSYTSSVWSSVVFETLSACPLLSGYSGE